MTDREQALEMARQLCSYDAVQELWICDHPSIIAAAILEARARECVRISHLADIVTIETEEYLLSRAAELRAQITQEAV